VRGNLLGILFTVLSGVLIFLTVFAYGRSDRSSPEFRFSSVDLVYDSQTKDNDLMVGINAFDAKDGDVSDRIVVEKVVLNREKETAVVYYAVADLSGNVTKQSRVFPADIKDIDNNAETLETLQEEDENPSDNTEVQVQEGQGGLSEPVAAPEQPGAAGQAVPETSTANTQGN
jgi:hypothetical protein